MKPSHSWLFMILAVTLAAQAPAAFAKKDGDPPGWMKGEKKGWQGESMPPGLSKKDTQQAEKEARKKAKEAEREAKKKAKEAEKAAREKQKNQ